MSRVLPSSSPKTVGEVIALGRRDAIPIKQQEIDSEVRKIQDLESRINYSKQKIEQFKKELGKIQSKQDPWITLQLKLYMELRKYNFNSIIIHSKDILTAITKPIDIPYEGRIYHLGKYKVSIDNRPASSRSQSSIICIESLDNKHKSCHHPSIKNYGEGNISICWGNRGSQIQALAKKRSYVETLLMIDQWLKTYGSSPFCGIRAWKSSPIKKTKTVRTRT